MFLFYMVPLDMRLEMRAMVSPVWAIWALKGPLSSVDTDMCHQIEFLDECLATETAGMTKPRPQPLGPRGRGSNFL